MVFLAALTLIAAAAAPNGGDRWRDPPASVRVTARATVRLLESATIRFDEEIAGDRRERDTIVHLDDGDHLAKIVEFE